MKKSKDGFTVRELNMLQGAIIAKRSKIQSTHQHYKRLSVLLKKVGEVEQLTYAGGCRHLNVTRNVRRVGDPAVERTRMVESQSYCKDCGSAVT